MSGWLLASCAGSEAGLGPSHRPPSSSPSLGRIEPNAPAPQGSAQKHAPGASTAPQLETRVAVVDPQELAELERRGASLGVGFSLGAVVRGRELRSTEELNRDPGFKSIFDVLRADLADTRAQHPGAKVTSIDGVRLFDAEWLRSKQMAFELVGVFNRLDRRAFYPAAVLQHSTCGEVRFVYRLRYDTEQGKQPMQFRLPMTLNVVFHAAGGDCAEAARAWQSPEGAHAQGATLLAEWLHTGVTQRFVLKSVEVNLQSVRYQSSMIPSMAGHIEYSMRVFHATDASRERFEPAPMENMPDVARLSKDRALWSELLALLREPATLRALDAGVLQLPDRFLARRAISVAPRGLARPANRPFRQLFSPKDFAGLELAATRTLTSPVALLRRLDGHSCVGCHQSRSIAGFHHVGDDPASTPDYAALHSGLSPHLRAELERRRDYVAALASGEAPDEFRPIPERQGVGTAYGAPCGLGDPGLADWACAPGLRCVALEDPEVGACFAEGAVGEPCEYGEMVGRTRAASDRVARVAKHSCGAAMTCDTNFSGFPQGSCGTSCEGNVAERTCGDFLDVDAFQNCIRFRRPVGECARQHVFKTGLRACDEAHPCRQDYVCSRAGPDAGACLPPYFVYPLRLDGYPLRR